LLKDGLLKADWEISPSKRRVRTYRITPAGKKRLERDVSSFQRMLEGITRVISPAESS
jgi:PadR family transcriptional regulator, regulatory protein PadR